MSSTLTRDEIATAYRLILDRDPQDEAVIVWHQQTHASIGSLRSFLIGSLEFSRLIGNAGELGTTLAFEAVYARKPDGSEVDHLRRYVDAVQASSPSEVLRAVVTAFDRQRLPTPVSVRFGNHNLLVADINDSRQRLVLDRQDFSVANTIINTSEYELHLRRFIEAVVQPGMVCVDIGANVGFHAFVMSELVGDEGHVYAIEPNSENCRMLMLSVKENESKNLTVVPLALSDKLGAVAFSPAWGSNGCFMYDVSGDPLRHPNCTIVPTARLDDVLKLDRLDFIKIDVEGAEPLALTGAENLITTHRPIITSEFSAAMIEGVSSIDGATYLHERMRHGYRAFTLGLSGPFQEIVDPDAFMAGWPDRFRIEDLAFVPEERDFDYQAFQAD